MNQAIYHDLLHKAGPDQHSHDYAALDQGPEGTGARHAEVVRLMGRYLDGGRVLDMGCGTGLLIEALEDRGVHLAKYRGIDFLEHRRNHVQRRLSHFKIEGSFVIADLLDPLQWAEPDGYDVCLMVGVAGYPPFNSVTKVLETVEWMRRTAKHGMVTLPKQREGFLGCNYQAHFDLTDVKAIVDYRDPRLQVIALMDKEVIIWW